MTEYGFPVFTLCSVVLDLLPLTQDVSGTQRGYPPNFTMKPPLDPNSPPSSFSGKARKAGFLKQFRKVEALTPHPISTVI